ncbi:MAG: 50S ribosomal protein L1 [Acidiferrobacterales bacterium]|nr:50S ribosomal protein L1 [Gammaproteobacteria bacterium]
MAKTGKRIKRLYEKFDRTKPYSVEEGIRLVKDTAGCKFDESVDVSINLGIDARKSDQNVRGTTVLPRGTGKTVRVAVFAEGEQAEAAKQAGADIVGFQDLADSIKAGKLDFDMVIATPDAMKIVGKLGPILGPRGLMPNPKVGTVTPNVTKAVENAKAGQVQYRNDKAGIVQCSIGKASFDIDALKENLAALMDAVQKSKSSGSKGTYIQRVTLSTTMGPGVRLDSRSF